MTFLPRLTAALLALVLVGGAQAAPADDYILDGAGLFSSETLVEANERIGQLAEKTKVIFWVQTLKKLPEETIQALGKIKVSHARESAEFFRTFARELAEKEKLHGIVAMISDDPKLKLATVVVTSGAVADLFKDPADCETIRRMIASRAFGQFPDRTLLQIIEKVEDTMLRRSTETSISWPLLGAILAGLLGVWLLLSAIRMRMAQRHSDPDKKGNGRQPRHIGGLFGGLFGVLAGHWIYDTLFEQEQQKPAEVVNGGNPLDDQIELSATENTPVPRATPQDETVSS